MAMKNRSEIRQLVLGEQDYGLLRGLALKYQLSLSGVVRALVRRAAATTKVRYVDRTKYEALRGGSRLLDDLGDR